MTGSVHFFFFFLICWCKDTTCSWTWKGLPLLLRRNDQKGERKKHVKGRSGLLTDSTHTWKPISVCQKALTADILGHSRPQSDPAGKTLTKTEARHGFFLIIFFCPYLCVCVSVCILVYATERGPKYTFHLEMRTFWRIKNMLAGPHSIKGLFEGQKWV